MSRRVMALAGLSLVFLTPAGLAAAQDFSGAATLGYGRLTVADVDQSASILSLDGKFDVKFDSGLSFGADFSGNSLNVEDVSETLTASTIGLEAAYRFANNISAGAYVEHSRVDIDDFGFNLSATSYGLSGGYAVNGATFKGFVGTTTYDDADGVDVVDLGLIAGVQAAPNLFLAGSVLNTNLSDGADDVNLRILGAAAVYGIDDSLTVFAGIADTSLDIEDANLTTFGLGVSYDLTSVASFAASVSLELARTNLDLGGDSGNLDTVRLGVTIPMGGGNAKVPLNSVAGAVMNPRHSAESSAVLSTF